MAQQLWTVMAAAVEILTVDSAGLLLVDDHNRLRTVGFTDQPASTLDDSQLEIGQGPGIDSWQRHETVAVTDLAAVPAYNALWTRICACGVRAVLSLPLHSQGVMIGSLNLVRNRAHAWTAIEIRAGQACAKVVSVTLALAATVSHTAHDPDGTPAF
jgi:GAF domain-containing protein